MRTLIGLGAVLTAATALGFFSGGPSPPPQPVLVRDEPARPAPWDATLPIVKATADLAGDPTRLEGADIQAAICSATCNERCAIELARGIYEDVEVQFPEDRTASFQARACDLNKKNECDRLGYTTTTPGPSARIEMYGWSQSETVLRLADRTADHRSCIHTRTPPGPRWHLRGAITVRELSEGIALHDFTIDGRLGEQPAPPGNQWRATQGTYAGIAQTRTPSATLTPSVVVKNITFRDIPETALILHHAGNATVEGVRVENAGISSTEPGNSNPYWAAVPDLRGGNPGDKTTGLGIVTYSPGTITGNSFSGIVKMAIECLGCKDVTFAHNVFRRSRVGINVGHFGSPYPARLRIEHNQFEDMGFAQDRGPSLTGEGIDLFLGAVPPDVLDFVLVRNNVFVGGHGAAMRTYFNELGSATVRIEDNVMERNCLRRSDFGHCSTVFIFGSDNRAAPRGRIDRVFGTNAIDAQPATIGDSGRSVEVANE